MPTMAGAKSEIIPSTGPLAATVPAVLDVCVTTLDKFGGADSPAEVMQPRSNLPKEIGKSFRLLRQLSQSKPETFVVGFHNLIAMFSQPSPSGESLVCIHSLILLVRTETEG
jgi:hypothetical protein